MNKFIEGLKENNIEKIRTVPKADVHNHLTRGMTFERLNKYLDYKMKKPPQKFEGMRGLEEYIKQERNKLLADKQGYRTKLMEMAIEDAIHDGVTYLEASVGIDDYKAYNDLNHFLYTMDGLVAKYRSKITFKPEIAINTSTDSDTLINVLLPIIDSHVFKSIDLYGDEDHIDFCQFRPYYQYAKKHKMKLKMHIGEFSGEDLIKPAIEMLTIDELQHGFRCYYNADALELIKKHNISLNICPSSNQKLGAVPNLLNHPMKELYDCGIKITINTDDLVVFDSTVSEEYLKLYNLGIFNEYELNNIRLNSL